MNEQIHTDWGALINKYNGQNNITTYKTMEKPRYYDYNNYTQQHYEIPKPSKADEIISMLKTMCENQNKLIGSLTGDIELLRNDIKILNTKLETYMRKTNKRIE